MKRFAASLIVLSGASLVLAGAELVLQDGQTLQGVGVRRAGDQYLLELESGDVLTLPASLVRSVRLTGDDIEPPTGLVNRGPDVLAGPPDDEGSRKQRGPSGIRRGDPQVLAGEPVRPPRTSDQLKVLGEPSRFQRSPVDPSWAPGSAFDSHSDVLEQGRANWQGDILEPDWTPSSAFDADHNVLKPGRSRWQESIIDPSWRPADGFHPWRSRG